MNDVALTDIRVPAHLANRLGAKSSFTDTLIGGIGEGGPSYPRISLKGSRFRIVEGKSETVLPHHELEVVIVGANPGLTKTFYGKAWNQDDEPTQPTCQSMDGITPDNDVEAPQSDSCATCPHSQWGSKIAPNGQKLKACSDSKRLAVVPAGDPSGQVMLLQVTPAALAGFRQYIKELSLKGIPPEVVKTVLLFDTNASFPKLNFKFGGFLSEQQQGAVDQRFGKPDVMEVTGEDKTAAKRAPVTVAKPMLVAPKVEALPPTEVPSHVMSQTATVTANAAVTAKSYGFGGPVNAEPAAPKPAKAQKPDPVVIDSGDDLAKAVADLMSGLGDD